MKPLVFSLIISFAACPLSLWGNAADFSSTYVKYESPRGTYGWRTSDGELVIPAMFDDVGDFSCGLCSVKLGGLYGYFDYDGLIVAPVRFLEAGAFQQTPAGTPFAEVRDIYGWNFIDQCGLPVFPNSKPKRITDEKTLGMAYFYLDSRAALRADDAFRENFTDYAMRYINTYLSFWYPKNEYETTEDWRIRTTSEKTAEKIEELRRMSIARFVAERGTEQVSPKEFKILKYNADNSAYLLSHKRYGTVIVPVPRKESAEFRREFVSAKLSAPEYTVGKNDRIMLKSVDIELPNGKVYHSDPSRVFEAAVELPGMEIELPGEGGFLNVPPRPANSDVDNNIPENKIQAKRNRFVCIIANESYENESDVLFAGNDGFIFRQYCEKTLGIPADNIIYRKNATLAQMNSAVSEVCRRADAFPNAEVIFYYAGHGASAGKLREPYLLPVDCRADSVGKGGFELLKLYEKFHDCKAKSVLVFLDAGFGNVMRDGTSLSKGGRVPRMEPESGTPLGRTIAFTAASGRESANHYSAKSHGLFTYFLLKKLQETRGNVSLGDLVETFDENVNRTAMLVHNRAQNPTVAPAEDVSENWESFSLK